MAASSHSVSKDTYISLINKTLDFMVKALSDESGYNPTKIKGIFRLSHSQEKLPQFKEIINNSSMFDTYFTPKNVSKDSHFPSMFLKFLLNRLNTNHQIAIFDEDFLSGNLSKSKIKIAHFINLISCIVEAPEAQYKDKTALLKSFGPSVFTISDDIYSQGQSKHKAVLHKKINQALFIIDIHQVADLDKLTPLKRRKKRFDQSSSEFQQVATGYKSLITNYTFIKNRAEQNNPFALFQVAQLMHGKKIPTRHSFSLFSLGYEKKGGTPEEIELTLLKSLYYAYKSKNDDLVKDVLKFIANKPIPFKTTIYNLFLNVVKSHYKNNSVSEIDFFEMVPSSSSSSPSSSSSSAPSSSSNQLPTEEKLPMEVGLFSLEDVSHLVNIRNDIIKEDYSKNAEVQSLLSELESLIELTLGDTNETDLPKVNESESLEMLSKIPTRIVEDYAHHKNVRDDYLHNPPKNELDPATVIEVQNNLLEKMRRKYPFIEIQVRYQKIINSHHEESILSRKM